MFYDALALQRKAQSKDDLKHAVEKYKKALAIFEQVGFSEGVAQATGQLANIYSALGEYDKALEYYEKILIIFTKLRTPANTAKTLGNIGTIYYHWRQYDKALEYFQKNLEICKRISDRQGERACLLNLGNVHRAIGQYAKAAEYYEKALETARKIGDVKGEGDVLHNLGNVYADWGQYDKAEEVYLKSLDIRRRIKDVRGEGGILHNLGNVYKERGQYAKAAETYKKGLETAGKMGAAENEPLGFVALGFLYQQWGQYAKSVEFLEKGLALFRKLKDIKGEGGALNNLGNVYLDWGQYDKAEEFYEKALALDVRIGDIRGEGLVLTNLGLVCSHRGEYDKAHKAFDKALQICERTGIPADRPKDLIGNLYLDMGEAGKAELFIRQAKQQSSLGRLYLVKGDYTSAVKSYENLLKSSEASRNVDDLFTAYTGLGMSHEAIGDMPQAEEYYRKAVAFLENLRSGLSPSERETYFDVRVGGFYRTAPYEGLARVLVKMNRPVEALRESEYTRARIFAESISRRNETAGLDVPKEIRDLDAQLTDALAALAMNLQKAYEKGDQEQSSVLEPQVKEAKRKLAVHVDMLRKQWPLFAATRYPEPMYLKDSALKADEWILEYEVTDTGLCVFLVHGKQVVKAVFKPVSRKELDDKVRKFMDPFEGVNPQNYKAKLNSVDLSGGENSLSRFLLGDILPELPKAAAVVVVPDDCLGVIPFEMLALNSEGNVTEGKRFPVVTGAEFFGDRNRLSYYQSITALTLARTLSSVKGEGKKLLVLADPVFALADTRAQKGRLQPATVSKIAKELNESATKKMATMIAVEESQGRSMRYPRLKETSKLAEELGAIYSGRSDVFTGLDASKEVFLRELGPHLDQYKEIVFATHGYFGKNLPGIMEPVLMLTTVPPGTDGYLKLSEVMGLRMNAETVALTACMSGLGKTISGEGVMGMGRAFQYAGAKSVLMSLWSVHEDASVKLVEKFFRSLHEGKPKLEALRSARDEIRKEGYDHPFFWAPFIIVGEVN